MFPASFCRLPAVKEEGFLVFCGIFLRGKGVVPFQKEKITQIGNRGVLNLRSPNTRKKLRFSLRSSKPIALKLMHVSAKECLNTVGMLSLGDFPLFVF